jgi:hypothetical protein
MDELFEKGVAVIPCPADILDRFQLDTFLSEQKEYIESTTDTLFVMGGFGALGNPSSYHHPEVRRLRLDVFNYVKPLFKTLSPEHYVECLPDRFCIRNPGTSLSRESWHRDISDPTPSQTDMIFGGWINLNKDEPQYLSCVPYTHTDDAEGGGFTRIDANVAKEFKKRRQRIAVPPGHMLIFNEKTVHEVCPTKQSSKSFRLFMKYRLTLEPNPLFPDNMQVAQTQGVFPLSVVQNPPLYGRMHAACWKDRLEEFSHNIRPEFIDPKNKSYKRVYRFMPSLQESGCEMFAPYTDEELAILVPS